MQLTKSFRRDSHKCMEAELVTRHCDFDNHTFVIINTKFDDQTQTSAATAMLVRNKDPMANCNPTSIWLKQVKVTQFGNSLEEQLHKN